MKNIRVWFDHGLGDCAHFAHLLQLYREDGYTVQLHGEGNKEFVWRVAGAETVPLTDVVRHPWTYPPTFGDLGADVLEANKIAHNLAVSDPLPPLGDRAAAWKRLCAVRLDARPFVRQEAMEAAKRFMEGLPRPLVLFHVNGSNWAEQKSLPDATTCALLRILRERPYGLVMLDWDDRSPTIGTDRVRGIKPRWGHISVEELTALYSLADLLVGIDSGPLHWASTVPTLDVLGVFRQIHPVHCCIPSPRRTSMVSAEQRSAWEMYGQEWGLMQYRNAEPSGKEIAKAVDAILAKRSSKVVEALPDCVRRCVGRYIYRRVGHDERPMTLAPDGSITEGNAGCERVWLLRTVHGREVLTIDGDNGPIAHLERREHGIWCGRWTRFERMPIELVPHAIAETVREHPSWDRHHTGLWIRRGEHGKQDCDAIGEVIFGDAYRASIRPTLSQPEVVVDIGAHIGTFATLWHRKNPQAKIVCVEACPDNIPILLANVGSFATVVHAACTYASKVVLLNSVKEKGTATGGSIVVAEGNPPTTFGHLYWLDERPLPTITLEQLARDHEIEEIDVLKLDCEGSEFDILANTTLLPKTKFICGEYHGRQRWEELRERMFGNWHYAHIANNGELGIFHLENPVQLPSQWDRHDSGLWIRRGNAGDHDKGMIAEVLERDDYFAHWLPVAAKPESEVVVDIGAHIGAFAVAWHRRNPKAKIVCVEACPENIPLLQANVGAFATVVHAACAYGNSARLHNALIGGRTNTSGSTVRIDGQPGTSWGGEFPLDERPLPTVTLEQLAKDHGFAAIDVLKLDCEGSEFNILEQTSFLPNIRCIVGEYHDAARWEATRANRLGEWKYVLVWRDGNKGVFHTMNPSRSP